MNYYRKVVRIQDSYYLIYSGDIVKAFEENNIKNYVILNEKVASVYLDEDVSEQILDDIDEVQWWSVSDTMSSLIDIVEDSEEGFTVDEVTSISSVENNPYLKLTGKDILVAVIDSGVNYLHKDLIDDNNQSKIRYLWDQEKENDNKPLGIDFGTEYTRENLNKAILENDDSLSSDEIGNGTMACGIICGQGNIERENRGIAKDSELIVVKLRGLQDIYKKGTYGYSEADFLAAIKYVTDIALKENKPLIINLTVGSRSNIRMEASILESYKALNRSGIVVVSGVGNEGNTDTHYSNNLPLTDLMYQDVLLQNGDNENLYISISGTGPDKIGLQIISPSGDTSRIIQYSPDNQIYTDRFNVEGTDYKVVYRYPWLETGEQHMQIQLIDIKAGVWTIRIIPELIINGNYDIYLPNKKLISPNTRFLDPISTGTITKFALSRVCITIGAYNNKINSTWIGSSKGSIRGNKLNPDIVAPGVRITSTYKDGGYKSATGTGISSSIVSGSLALIMEYLNKESTLPKISTFTDSLKTYLAIGAIRNEAYLYPNVSQGYGVFDLNNTLKEIGKNL